MSQKTAATKTQSPALKSLELFVGKWTEDGQAFDSPFGPSAKVTSIQTWEWLPGKMFLIHRLQGRLGENDTACIEIIGSDTSSQSYSVNSFYNDGNQNVWQLSERDGTWTLNGDWKSEGETTKVRCTILFNGDGNTMTGKWEYSKNSPSWQVFWDTKLIRERQGS